MLSDRQFAAPAGPRAATPKGQNARGKEQRSLASAFPTYQHPEGMGELISQADIARHLGVTTPAVSNWVSRGHLPNPKVMAGRSGLWDKQEITDWHNGRKPPGGNLQMRPIE